MRGAQPQDLKIITDGIVLGHRFRGVFKENEQMNMISDGEVYPEDAFKLP